MKIFQLFNEFCERRIYGEDFDDALRHAGPLKRPDRPSRTSAITMDEVDPIVILKIIGHEDTSDKTRGNKKFHRAIVETDQFIRIAIDGEEIGTVT